MQIFKDLSYFRLLLKLIALHSLLVGVGLIIFPSSVLAQLGFVVDDFRFFSTQGGVFHIVMVLAYWRASMDPQQEPSLIWFIISAKSIALIFLMSFFLLRDGSPMIAISGIGDGAMAFLVYLFQREQKLLST